MKKKTRKKARPASPAPKKRLSRIPKKKLLLLLLSLLVFFSIYQIAIHFRAGWILHVYCISAGALAIAYIAINRGMLSPPDRDRLPDDWSEEKKETFLQEQLVRRRRSSVLLYFLIPIILSVVYDMIYIYLTVNMGLSL